MRDTLGGGSLDLRELECFLVLAEELHFGRAGERLYVSQSRVSQLLRALESRIGARLVERTSRRVRLTPLGERFLAELGPAYGALRSVVDGARAAARGVEGSLRVGFQGTAHEQVTAAVTRFQQRYPACAMELVELPWRDPFGAARRGEVDLAVVLAPVAEDDLVVGAVFSRQPQAVAVAASHPFAARPAVDAEELAHCPLIGVPEPAPAYWRDAVAPRTTPAGRPIPQGPAAGTLQEALALAAAGRGALLLCRPTADQHGRGALARVPVTGLPDSALALVWHRDRETARVRAFAEVLAESP
ncbi:LysR family transcriptional regulator [Allostreptomyces psammosilenae]|uniref:DNA-binding transcriptional LysR family regulator n=1 Tax=Allostreptomyces psammosilenae TaxID=1892865 RepID=A0A852ZMX3_9ACTN|nr:LysR family transcriptional regulator [Allostreptomyces psammosilenae]NYI03763.1 DNA-binding transcriptional LysR family regulator [Allostreptomyces psammosilenae]